MKETDKVMKKKKKKEEKKQKANLREEGIGKQREKTCK